MQDMNLYNIDSAELYELIDDAIVELKKENLEYKKLADEIIELKNSSSNIRNFLESENIVELDKKDCEILKKLIDVCLTMRVYEERKIFFIGARENYYYFKNLGIIK